MIRTKLGLLGLCAMLFGLMAFGATGAHAEVGAKWLLAEKAPNSGLIPLLKAQLQLKKDTTAVLHSKILGIEVLFLCEKIEALNAFLLEEGIIGNTVVTNGSGLKEGRGSQIHFRECVTHLNGVTAPECTPKDPTLGAGAISTKLGHALLKLHALAGGTNDDVIKVLPDEGETFATISMSATCPIGTTVPVIGSLTLKDCQGLGRSHLVEHLVEAFTPLTALWTISKTEEHKATLLGSAWARLIGAHEGLKFGGDPN